MLELVNRERRKRGLQTLKPDPELTKVARDHSVDMLQRGYFSHYPRGVGSVRQDAKRRRTLFNRWRKHSYYPNPAHGAHGANELAGA
ncbi:CAP domain-containing protein [Mucilaginibacter sp. S1162]|uniref:CAP domain-containing protein n=1 Tax=Mucilaginibacter humi TaxID=2732510 RepID=A0ABX1W106_9SPHI|nr:CAP domain-containing protein [Mucilaginibacter humi]